MRILVALHDYLPAHAGGSEVHAHEVAREMVRRGHRVWAAFTERDLSRAAGELERGELDGVQTLQLIHQREYADVRESYLQEDAGRAFEEILAEVRPEVLHFHHLSLWGAAALGAARRDGARVVVTLHDYHLLCDNAVLLRSDHSLCTEGPAGTCTDCLARHPVLAERWDGAGRDQALARAARERLELHRDQLAQADVVVAPSRFLAGVFRDAGLVRDEQLLVLRYGYPGPRHAPRVPPAEGPLRVGYIGGLYPSKGVHVLVEAFSRLEPGLAELELRGHLDWFPDYVEELKRLAAGRPVRFGGPFARDELDRVLDAFDVLVVPSIWYENLPLTIQEAFRNGLPVVTTDLGGMAESVEDDVSGLVFPRGDAAALAERLAGLARDRAWLARLAQGRPHVPDLGEIADRLEAAYRGDGARG